MGKAHLEGKSLVESTHIGGLKHGEAKVRAIVPQFLKLFEIMWNEPDDVYFLAECSSDSIPEQKLKPVLPPFPVSSSPSPCEELRKN